MSETKIQAARAAVAAVQTEVDNLRARLEEMQRELATLSSEDSQLDAAALSRRHALVEAIDNVRARLPRQNWRRGESLPLLQVRLQQAQQELEQVRLERWRLSETIAEVEAERDLWGAGVPATVESSLRLVAQTLQRVDEYPPNLNGRSWSGLVAWASGIRQRIESLPALRERLSTYGADDDYEPAPDLAEFARAWPSYRDRLRRRMRLPG
jgi:hypothetical protein